MAGAEKSDRSKQQSRLGRILERCAERLVETKRARPLAELRAAAENATALRPFSTVCADGGPAIIAEVKKASPSKGLIRAVFDHIEIARGYEAGGAAAVSVLTEPDFFQGSLQYLVDIRARVSLPLLRKDFMLDEYQIYESRAAGADIILLIVAALDKKVLAGLHQLATELGMAALVEVHDEAELDTALSLNPSLLGVNNRNLKTFEVTLETFARLAPDIPEGVTKVAESGIFTADDIGFLRGAGADAFLIGESLMRRPDPQAALETIRGVEAG